MRRIMPKILCLLSCIILVMPQGWCCFFSPLPCCNVEMACCEVEKPAKSNCCCCENTPEDTKESPEPLKLKCSKCIHDVVKPPAQLVFDFDLALIGLLNFDVATSVAVLAQNSIVSLYGNGPPLHIQLCIWRC